MKISKIFSPEHTEHSAIGAYDDDVPVGKVLSRREILGLFAGAGTTVFLAGCVPLQSVINDASKPEATSTTSAAPASATASASTTTAATTTATTSSGAVLPTCVVVPELTEGPYFVDEKINRSDIRTDTKTGTV